MLATSISSRADTIEDVSLGSLVHHGRRLTGLLQILNAAQGPLLDFVRSADREYAQQAQADPQVSLLNAHPLEELSAILDFRIPSNGQGQDGVLSTIFSILKYSVNTFSPGFLDKLYAGTNAPGIVAELVLAFLNTNLHIYQVSPVLTIIEKQTTKALAALFGFDGPRAGGISVQGGSASNLTSIVVARNTLFPETKVHGNHVNGLDLVMFTSAHGHYSTEKAAQALGFGSAAVITVPVSHETGAMIPSALDHAIIIAKKAGKTPFYVNSTAGSTVLGSFDDFTAIAAIARKHQIWFHIDASWGGPFIFSEKLKFKLKGAELADSIAINPHKMMGVPVTCSFLLARDLKQFHLANTLPAGYLFHNDNDHDEPEPKPAINGTTGPDPDLNTEDDIETSTWHEPADIADLTLQCGRRGDSLKLFLSWQYYGTLGYAAKIEHAQGIAEYMASQVRAHGDLKLVNEPACLQVCFTYAPGGPAVFGDGVGQVRLPHSTSCKSNIVGADGKDEERARVERLGKFNSLVTERITKALIPKGFMIDFAPPLEGQEAEGKFFRVVVNIETTREVVERLIRVLCEVGKVVTGEMKAKYGVVRREEINGLPHGPVLRQKNPAERGHGPVVTSTDVSRSTREKS